MKRLNIIHLILSIASLILLLFTVVRMILNGVEINQVLLCFAFLFAFINMMVLYIKAKKQE